MGEQLDEVKQLRKGVPVDLHGRMFAVKHDAVFIVVDIGRVLESPFPSLDSDGDDPVVLPGRVIGTSCVSLILHAELTFRVGRGLCRAGRGNRLGVLLRLGEIDGNVQSAVLGIHGPFPVLFDAVAPDIITVLA